MDVTLLGRVTDVREVHDAKAWSPYESNDVVMINNNNNNNNSNNNNNNNNNSNTNGCNTRRDSNGCKGGAGHKDRATL